MRVIFLEDVPGMARKNEVKEVREGYARNFLFSRGLAVPATDAALRQLLEAAIKKERRIALDKLHYEALARELSGITLSFKVKTPAKGKLFGSVNAAQIHAEFLKKKLDIKKEWIDLERPIKAVGEEHYVSIKFPYGIRASVRVILTGKS